MRVAIVKPDHGLTGGFELVMDRVAAHLDERGDEVVWLLVDSDLARRQFQARVSDKLRHGAPEFVNYLAMVEAARRVDAHRADMVISSQPPSFAVDHPRHLSVFYHHNRMFYDLDDVARRAHLVDDAIQPHAVELVRRLDQPMLDAVTYILAGSEDVARRLATFNNRTDRVGIFHAGLGLRSTEGRSAHHDRGYPLCVSRHEFPKRTELFVQAMKLLPDLRGVAVGTGGRLGYVQRLDAELTANVESRALCATAWLENPGFIEPLLRPTSRSNVEFAGWVPADDLVARYRGSSCVVAPAYLEDYGLTALEAMAFGKPVIVCSDGGHLARLVSDGVNGLVVDPDPQSVAMAIRRIHDDEPWAEQLGEAGRAVAAEFTWERALAELDAGIEQVMA